jgi:hypothetical protein
MLVTSNEQGRRARFLRLCLRYLGAFSLAGYLVWNLYWLAQFRVPPSIFYALTGWPSPTTGGTRAIVLLCKGEVIESVRYNAMAVPLVSLFLASVAWLTCQALGRKRLRLPISIFWAWVTFLGLAWILKLTGNPMYW